MKIFKLALILLISYFCSISTSYAFNSSFLEYSPVFYFTNQDWNMIHKATDEALNHAADGVKVNWKNPKSGAFGYVIPSNTAKTQSGIICRNLMMFSNAHELQNQSSFRFCKIQGKWKVVS